MNPNFKNYQYPEDIPEQYLEIVEELRQQVQNIRSKHLPPKKLSKNKYYGNAAIAKLELAAGNVYTKEATSKEEPLNIPEEEGGPKLFFEPRFDRVASLDNKAHAEYKIFNALAEDLEKDAVNSDVKGILYLYTERNMCSGCFITSEEDFKGRFPDIKKVVFYTRPYPEK